MPAEFPVRSRDFFLCLSCMRKRRWHCRLASRDARAAVSLWELRRVEVSTWAGTAHRLAKNPV